MNRRTFLKLLGIGALGVFSPKLALEVERNTMQIGEIFVKLGKGEKLSESELQTIRLFGNQAELGNQYVNGLQDGTSSLNVKNVKSYSGDFIYPPSGVAVRVKRNASQSISDSTFTDVSFDTEVYDDISMWDAGSPANININVTGRYVIAGKVVWSASTNTGYRVAGVYDRAVGTGTWIANSTDYPTATLHRNVFYDEVTLTKGQTLSFSVKQFSGSSATLVYSWLLLRLVKVPDSETSSQ